MVKNLLTIEDATVKQMLKDPRSLELLPCLQGPKAKIDGIKPGGRECDRCEADKKRIMADAMRVAKNCIRNSRGERLSGIKEVLGARQLRLTAKNSKGKRVQYTL